MSSPLTKVNLQQLDDAIQAVSKQADIIALRTSTVGTLLAGVPGIWQTPAEVPFSQVAAACAKQLSQLSELCQEMVARMRAAYQNYLAAEQGNLNNLTAR
jgi:hypothetical protein